MQRLYDLGSRQVLVTGVGPLGCVPAILATRSRTGACDLEMQRVPDMYNPQLVQLMSELNSHYGADVFVAVNAFKMHMDFISDPAAYGNQREKTQSDCMRSVYRRLNLPTHVTP
ncbi:hypothetical protein B296_00044585 [Ensete ventricosum]|uniref:GDSL esterase/lipase n=1 Tax=Ensete ventricosum TaxID=4639 RepID=A0A426X0Y4_ENSVE|nr:hypothetical protein B296_00044585 [Ensete ventricosum]